MKKFLALTFSTLLLANSSIVFAYQTKKYEHLHNDYKYTNQNQVEIGISKCRIMSGNVMKAVLLTDYNTKQAADSVMTLTLDKDLSTQEGTLLLPAKTLIIGKIDDVIAPKKFHRNSKVHFTFDKAILPTGEEIPIKATVNTKTGYIGAGYNQSNLKKDAVIVLTAAGIGTGVGAIIGLAGTVVGGVIIGSSVGGGTGLVTAATIPGRNMKYKKGTKFDLKFDEDLILNVNNRL